MFATRLTGGAVQYSKGLAIYPSASQLLDLTVSPAAAAAAAW